MRQIEFRGRRINNATKEYEFVYGSYLKQASKISGKTREVEEWNHYIVNVYGDKLRVIPETVGQYTGLKDKDGNKIFEDDIVEDDNTYLGKVLFDDKSAGFIVYLPEECDDANLAYLGGEMMPSNEMYIISGNIHDNPELLQ